MTQHEALVLGMVWGGLARTIQPDGWTLSIPSYGSDDEHAAAVAVLRTPDGTELLITVTETRTPPKPEV